MHQEGVAGRIPRSFTPNNGAGHQYPEQEKQTKAHNVTKLYWGRTCGAS